MNDTLETHGILMSVAFGIFFPASVIVSRYFKEQLDTFWTKLHVLFVSLATIMLLYSCYLVRLSIDWTNNHVLLGLFILLLIAVQIGLGISCHYDHDPDLKEEENTRDIAHGWIGLLILVLGCCCVVDGMMRRVLKESLIRQTPIAVFIAWLVALLLFFGMFEYYRGRTSRYSKGNIFAACSQFGAKKLFSVSGKQRMGIIDANVVDPNATIISGIMATPRTKEGALSPFMYRPTWDTGLKKPKPIESLVPTEQFMQKQEEVKPQVSANPLARLADQERLPRSRSNSIKGSPAVQRQEKRVRSPSVAGSSMADNEKKIGIATENSKTRGSGESEKRIGIEPENSRGRAPSSLSVPTRPRGDSVIERLAEKLTKEMNDGPSTEL